MNGNEIHSEGKTFNTRKRAPPERKEDRFEGFHNKRRKIENDKEERLKTVNYGNGKRHNTSDIKNSNQKRNEINGLASLNQSFLEQPQIDQYRNYYGNRNHLNTYTKSYDQFQEDFDDFSFNSDGSLSPDSDDEGSDEECLFLRDEPNDIMAMYMKVPPKTQSSETTKSSIRLGNRYQAIVPSIEEYKKNLKALKRYKVTGRNGNSRIDKRVHYPFIKQDQTKVFYSPAKQTIDIMNEIKRKEIMKKPPREEKMKNKDESDEEERSFVPKKRKMRCIWDPKRVDRKNLDAFINTARSILLETKVKEYSYTEQILQILSGHNYNFTNAMIYIKANKTRIKPNRDKRKIRKFLKSLRQSEETGLIKLNLFDPNEDEQQLVSEHLDDEIKRCYDFYASRIEKRNQMKKKQQESIIQVIEKTKTDDTGSISRFQGKSLPNRKQ